MRIPTTLRTIAMTIVVIAAALSIAPAIAGERPPHAMILTSGGFDATITPTSPPMTSIRTAAIAPGPKKRVLVFITIGIGRPVQVATPTLSGGRVTWRLVSSVTRGNHLSRLEVLYTAVGVHRGHLRISFPRMEGWLAWSIDQTAGRIVQVGTAISKDVATGGRVTSLAVQLPSAPEGVVVAGFASGQTGDLSATSPAVTLGNGHSSYLSTESQFARSRTQSASWSQLAHAMVIAVDARP